VYYWLLSYTNDTTHTIIILYKFLCIVLLYYFQVKPPSSANTYQYTDGDKFSKKKLQRCVFVCLALFVFCDFSCVHVFKKSVRCIFAELNVKPVTYEQCALLVTALQVTERSGSLIIWRPTQLYLKPACLYSW